MSAGTLPGLLLEREATSPNAVAFRYFRHGKWNDVTIAQLKAKAAAIGSGLAGRGIASGEVIAIIAEDGPLFLAAEIGAQGIGARVLALDPSLGAGEVVAAISAAGAVGVIVGDQEQFDKVDESRGELPTVRLLVVDATRGLRHLEIANRPDGDSTLTVSQLEAGAVATGWEASALALAPSDGARAEGINTRSHASVVEEARQLVSRLLLTKHDVLCAMQPVADPVEHALSVAGPLISASVVHFRGRASVQQALRQVQPTIIHATPQWLARISSETDAQVSRATGLKKLALQRGLTRRMPANAIASRRRLNPIRLGGLAAAAAIFVLFLTTSSANDVARIALAFALLIGFGVALLLSGNAAASPVRRRYGLSRCRAVLTTDGTGLIGADLLGALDVPLIDAKQEVTS